MSKGALDVLMEAGWAADAGTPKGAGSAHHLRHDERVSGRVRAQCDRGICRASMSSKGAGLFEGNLPAGYDASATGRRASARADEDPLEDRRRSSKLWAASRRRKRAKRQERGLGRGALTASRKRGQYRLARLPLSRGETMVSRSAICVATHPLRFFGGARRSAGLAARLASRGLMTSRWSIPRVDAVVRRRRRSGRPGSSHMSFAARPARATRPIFAR